MLRRSCASFLRSELIRSGTARKFTSPLRFRGISSSVVFHNINNDLKTKTTNDQTSKDVEEVEETREQIEAQMEALSQRQVDIKVVEEILKQEEGQEEVQVEEVESDAKELERQERHNVEVEQEVVADGDIPWYLRQEESSKLDIPIFKAEIPELPKGAPASLQRMLHQCSQTLGLDNIKIFDIRDREDLFASAHMDFMVIVSGKSEKHIQNAVDEFSAYLKHEFKTVPYIEGLLKANSIKRHKSRMKRKARKGTLVDTEFGVGPNSWVMIDTGVDSIAIHVMTKERREVVNLEYLWCKPEEKDAYRSQRVSNEIQADVDSIFYGLQRRYYTTGVDVDLVTKAIQHLKLRDVQGLEKISVDVQTDNEASFKILKEIINKISSMKLDEAYEALAPRNEYVFFFNELFPISPTLQHWELKFQFYTLLNSVRPGEYPFSNITDILVDQAASGEFITRQQLDEFISLLITNTRMSAENNIKTKEIFNKHFKTTFKNLSKVLQVWDIQTEGEIDENLMIQLLLLSSQEPTEAAAELGSHIPVASAFKQIYELFHEDAIPSNNVIQIVLTTFANAHDYEYFWKCWEDLTSYKATSTEVVYDVRPWDVLIDVVLEVNLGKLNDDFINQQIPTMLENHVEITKEMKAKIIQICENYGVPVHAKLLV